jgi:hypothetical protein
VNRNKARVPWEKLQGAQDDLIDPMYLSEGIQLKQFHHIRQDEANAILKYWDTRQAAGATPFCFKSTDKATFHGKRASASADEAQAQEDGDPQENGNGNLDDNELFSQGGGDAAGNACSVSRLPKHGDSGY